MTGIVVIKATPSPWQSIIQQPVRSDPGRQAASFWKYYHKVKVLRRFLVSACFVLGAFLVIFYGFFLPVVSLFTNISKIILSAKLFKKNCTVLLGNQKNTLELFFLKLKNSLTFHESLSDHLFGFDIILDGLDNDI